MRSFPSHVFFTTLTFLLTFHLVVSNAIRVCTLSPLDGIEVWCPSGEQCVSPGALGSNSSLPQCIPCRYGEFCPPGTINANYSLHAAPCSDRFFCPNPSTQIQCPKGFICVNSTSSPFQCTIPGTFCNGTSEKPIPCDRGRYCPTPSSSLECPRGYYCRKGVVQPKKCPFLGICNKGSVAPDENLLLFTFLSIFSIILCAFFYSIWSRTRREETHQDTIYKIEQSYSSKLKKLGYAPVKGRVGAFDSIAENISRLTIEFQNIGYELESGKTIISGISGSFCHSSINVIMGPSGSGKSTFLDVIKKAESSRGQLSFNGIPAYPELMAKYRKQIAFVPQDDICHTNLTVYENIKYNVYLRQHRNLSEESKNEIVNEILEILDLKDVQNTVVGSTEYRGISGGQRKRVNIGMELCTCPDVLFLDEPTSGLDSASTVQIVKALKRMATLGMNVIAVIHQPRHLLFKYFDQILLLGTHGRPVYMGPRENVLQYFQSKGFTKEEDENTADFILDAVAGLISGENDIDLEEEWGVDEKCGDLSDLSERVKGLFDLRIEGDNSFQEKRLDVAVRIVPTPFEQFLVFLRRDFRILVRDVHSYVFDFFMLFFASILVGIVYGKSWTLGAFPLMATLASLAMGLIGAVTGIRVFGNERLIFLRESSAGVSIESYFCAKMVSQFLLVFSHPFAFAVIVYALVFPEMSFGNWYLLFVLVYWSCSGLGMAISVLLDRHSAMLSAVLLPMVLGGFFSGSFPPISELGTFAAIIADFSFTRWASEAFVIKEAQARPEYYPTDEMFSNGFKKDYFDNDVIVLCIMGVGFRLLTLFCLRNFKHAMTVRSIMRKLVKNRWKVMVRTVFICFSVLSVEIGLKFEAWNATIHLSWFQLLLPVIAIFLVYFAISLSFFFGAIFMRLYDEFGPNIFMLRLWNTCKSSSFLLLANMLAEISLVSSVFLCIVKLELPDVFGWYVVCVPVVYWSVVRIATLLCMCNKTFKHMIMYLIGALCILLAAILVWMKQEKVIGHSKWIEVLCPLLIPQIHVIYLYLKHLKQTNEFRRLRKYERIWMRSGAVLIFIGALVSEIFLMMWANHHLYMPLKVVFLPYWASLCFGMFLYSVFKCLFASADV